MLIDGDPGPHMRRTLEQAHASEKHAIAARMVAGSVPPRFCRPMIELAQNLDQAFAAFERL
jgi:hypothetical protein